MTKLKTKYKYKYIEFRTLDPDWPRSFVCELKNGTQIGQIDYWLRTDDWILELYPDHMIGTDYVQEIAEFMKQLQTRNTRGNHATQKDT